MLRDLPTVKFFNKRTALKLTSGKTADADVKPLLDGNPKWRLISVSPGHGNYYDPGVMWNIGCRGLLTLAFDDCVPKSDGMPMTPELRLFNNEHAENVLKFLDGWAWKEEHLLVHCDAGISRSAAISFFAVDYCGGNSVEYFRDRLNSGEIYPNWHVYKILCRVSGISEFEKNLAAMDVVLSLPKS